jgi:hypothetical protein
MTLRAPVKLISGGDATEHHSRPTVTRGNDATTALRSRTRRHARVRHKQLTPFGTGHGRASGTNDYPTLALDVVLLRRSPAASTPIELTLSDA